MHGIGTKQDGLSTGALELVSYERKRLPCFVPLPVVLVVLNGGKIDAGKDDLRRVETAATFTY
jgi:hypothetical protein